MHARVGEQAHQVERAAALATCARMSRVSTGLSKNDPSAMARLMRREVLIDDAPRADGEMAHLRVAHDARRQADGLPAGVQQHVGIACPQGVPHRGVGQRDGVAGTREARSPSHRG